MRWLVWSFCLLAELYETMNHYLVFNMQHTPHRKDLLIKPNEIFCIVAVTSRSLLDNANQVLI